MVTEDSGSGIGEDLGLDAGLKSRLKMISRCNHTAHPLSIQRLTATAGVCLGPGSMLCQSNLSIIWDLWAYMQG